MSLQRRRTPRGTRNSCSTRALRQAFRRGLGMCYAAPRVFLVTGPDLPTLSANISQEITSGPSHESTHHDRLPHRERLRRPRHRWSPGRDAALHSQAFLAPATGTVVAFGGLCFPPQAGGSGLCRGGELAPYGGHGGRPCGSLLPPASGGIWAVLARSASFSSLPTSSPSIRRVPRLGLAPRLAPPVAVRGGDTLPSLRAGAAAFVGRDAASLTAAGGPDVVGERRAYWAGCE